MTKQDLKLHIVSHTHWDREWYQTFEGYRKRLVLMMDELIDTLETNQDYQCFTLDGQTIVIDDYLEIRPENEDRLRKLITDGRIIAGPWYVMPDEFLVSAESLIRNLKYGREMAQAFGGKPMDCGYVVDIFGHNSQFPQILQGFGIGSAMLFRGAGDYPKDTFQWEARDGSAVLCARLDPDRCYSNFYFAVRWPFDGRDYEPEELARRMRELLDYALPRAVSNNLVMMDGVDHIEIEPRLPWIIEALRERIPGVEIVHTTFDGYFQAQREANPSLETIRGELYCCGGKGVNNGVLKNVLSSIVHLKQLNDECERDLTRWAEPFAIAAENLARGRMHGLIRRAWKVLMQNHPHDSICGCSITRVHEDNLFRFHQVMDITNEVTGHVLGAIAGSIDTSGDGADHAIVLFNPMQREFSDVAEVEAELPYDYPEHFLLTDGAGQNVPFQVTGVVPATSKGVFRFRRLPEFHRVKKVRLVFRANIPAVGYSTWRLSKKPVKFPGHGEYTYSVFNPAVRYRGTMLTGFGAWENEHLQVRLNPNGSLCVTHKATGRVYDNLGILEDGGDRGDGWNYRKPRHDTVVYSAGCNADVAVDADGPLLTRWRISTHMNIPAGLEAGETRRAARTVPMTVVTTVTMRAGSSRLEFRTEVENTADGHRLRVLFPTCLPAESWFASTPFSIERRPVRFADTSAFQEEETFVMPNQGFIALEDKAGMFAVYNKGLYEVQVTEDASRTVALTLFRSFPHEVGRDGSELGRMRMHMAFDYALEFAQASVPAAEMLLRAEAWRAGLRAVTVPAQAGPLPAERSWLAVRSASTVLSCCKHADGDTAMQVLRLYNPSDRQDEVELAFDRGIRSVHVLDHDETIVCTLPHDGNRIKLTVGEWKILTLGVMVDTVMLNQSMTGG